MVDTLLVTQLEKGIEKGLEKGLEKGREEEREKNILTMFNQDVSVDKIAVFVSSTVAIVEEILRRNGYQNL